MRRAEPRNQLTPVAMGVYVHFPWCLRKCPYCDFASLPAERREIPHDAYARAVVAELARRAEVLGEHRLESVFFGGGTPSLWHADALGSVLAAITRTFEPAAELEVTVECNPSSLDYESARALADRGVNRFSIGVQSLDAERLAFLGRLHDVESGLRALRDALASGVPRVSADLIFGVHGQSPDDAAREARIVTELGVEHVSAYALTIEPSTEFGRRAKQRSLPLLSDELVADSFVAVDEALGQLGFEHYEISNYARPGARSRHNVGYWTGRPYLGLGSAAFGTVTLPSGRVRYRNTPNVERYLAAHDSGEPLFEPGQLVSEVELIDAKTALAERIMLGLRLAEGLDLDAVGQELGVDPWTRELSAAVERLCARGRLARQGGVLAIPKSAWLFADGTIAELL